MSSKIIVLNKLKRGKSAFMKHMHEHISANLPMEPQKVTYGVQYFYLKRRNKKEAKTHAYTYKYMYLKKRAVKPQPFFN